VSQGTLGGVSPWHAACARNPNSPLYEDICLLIPTKCLAYLIQTMVEVCAPNPLHPPPPQVITILNNIQKIYDLLVSTQLVPLLQ
jgi:hypothetical protein